MGKMHRKKLKIVKILIYIVLILLALSILYPFLYMLLASFKGKSEYYTNMFGFPRMPSLLNYRVAFQKFNILRLAKNSLIVAGVSVIGNCLISSMAAYGFSKLPFSGSSKILRGIIACMMVPGQMLIIPVYLMMARTGLANHYLSVILFYIATAIPFGTYMMTAQCRGIPGAILEAAEIDGCGFGRMYMSVILPFLKPSIITLVILNFMTFWNELLYSMLLLQTPEVRTLTVEIASIIGKYNTNMPLMMTGLLVNCIPTILVFLFFQKYIAKGLMAGAIK